MLLGDLQLPDAQPPGEARFPRYVQAASSLFLIQRRAPRPGRTPPCCLQTHGTSRLILSQVTRRVHFLLSVNAVILPRAPKTSTFCDSILLANKTGSRRLAGSHIATAPPSS